MAGAYFAYIFHHTNFICALELLTCDNRISFEIHEDISPIASNEVNQPTYYIFIHLSISMHLKQCRVRV